jgi:hypothetical protein
LDLPKRPYTKIHTYKVSRIIRAPIRFVFDWCTDYRESDPKITGTKSRRKILSRKKNRVVYLSQYRMHRKPRSAVNVVTLYPHEAWHLDFIGDGDEEVGEYVLKRLGPRKTRLDMTFQEHYTMRGAPSKTQDIKATHEVWDKYVAALERDYTRRK